jgi:hypothetical protein
MMQATDFGDRDDRAESRRLDWPTVGGVLGEREMSAGLDLFEVRPGRISVDGKPLRETGVLPVAHREPEPVDALAEHLRVRRFARPDQAERPFELGVSTVASHIRPRLEVLPGVALADADRI